MSDTVTQQFVTQFDNSLRKLAQQTKSRFRSTVTDRGQITGASFTINNLGTVEMDESVTRHGDTIWSDIDHTNRNVPMRDFFKALPLDRQDIPKMLVNPVTGGDYMAQLIAARNRKQDDIIFNAGLGPISSLDSSQTFVLPSSQVIVAGGTGLTKAKIIQARALFRANETDGVDGDGDEIFFAYDSLAMQQILSDTQLTSADFMMGKMLQEGQVAGKWMGFTWVPYERVRRSGGITTTMAWAKSGIHFGTGFEQGNVAVRHDKKDSWQVSMAGSYGAGRQDEKKIVQVSYQ